MNDEILLMEKEGAFDEWIRKLYIDELSPIPT